MRLRSAQETAGSGSGSRKTWRWSKAATSFIALDSRAPLPNTSPLMSPTPMQVKGSVEMSLPISRKWRSTATQAPPRGDAHDLVVVAGRAPRREGVAEPEAVVGRHSVGDVGEGRRALVGRHDQIGIVAVVGDQALRPHHRGRGVQVVGEVEQAAEKGPCRPRTPSARTASAVPPRGSCLG